ncbi:MULTISPECIES: helix-turn-helix transcriptional regulator [Bacillus cereus group]|uniref:helix-turn-helix transcriptional regulator n=1 Tax=Bacillus cereus group TaxID=86661 RepID=UPI0011A6C2AB|nr:helix-turn-helix transcriptional regulator [Bacillus thuringiensis]MED1637470.1 helix-turn-helix transcriptional regulator [Bacillus thuringiensis]QPW48932.1 helix-turn-helix transcriptional regulator [Bacillus thuringiensis]HDR7495016.1 helix-turn-helix transcriptional regulator [Bacillus cereus]
MKSELKQILDKRGIKYSHVAKQAKISNSAMTNLLKGGLPTLPVAYRIARVLEMKLEDIWVEEGEDF